VAQRCRVMVSSVWVGRPQGLHALRLRPPPIPNLAAAAAYSRRFWPNPGTAPRHIQHTTLCRRQGPTALVHALSPLKLPPAPPPSTTSGPIP
jgi:hypothetical protein